MRIIEGAGGWLDEQVQAKIVLAWRTTPPSRHWSQTTTIRSASSTSLDVRRTRLSTVGDRAFPVAAACLWNSLPSHVTGAPLSLPSSAVVLNHISSHFLIPLSDSSLICTVAAQWLVILDTIIASTCRPIHLKHCAGSKPINTAPYLKLIAVPLLRSTDYCVTTGNWDFVNFSILTSQVLPYQLQTVNNKLSPGTLQPAGDCWYVSAIACHVTFFNFSCMVASDNYY